MIFDNPLVRKKLLQYNYILQHECNTFPCQIARSAFDAIAAALTCYQPVED